MPALASPYISLALLAAFLTGAALGYKWRDNSAKLAESEQAQRYTQALNQALDKARQQEQTLYAQMEALAHDAEQKINEAIAAAERAAADNRLLQLATDYANRPAATNPATTPSCEATTNRARMLAELLAQSDQLAQRYAQAADKSRIAGMACEAAYQAAREASD